MSEGRGSKVKRGGIILLEENIQDLVSALSEHGCPFYWVTFVNSVEMPHVLGSLIEGDLERENILLKVFLLLSSIALLPPAEYFWVLPAQPHLSLKAKGLKKAHLISVTRAHIWSLGKTHPL